MADMEKYVYASVSFLVPVNTACYSDYLQHKNYGVASKIVLLLLPLHVGVEAIVCAIVVQTAVITAMFITRFLIAITIGG